MKKFNKVRNTGIYKK